LAINIGAVEAQHMNTSSSFKKKIQNEDEK
jgi:hypothetical protein